MSATAIQTLHPDFLYPIFDQQIEAGNEVLELRVSHSSIAGQFASCARKFEFGKLFLYSRDDTEEDEGNLAGEVGKALHVGHQTFMNTKNKEQAFFEMMTSYPIHLNDNPMDFRSVEACYGTLETMMALPAMENYEIAQVKLPNGEIRPAVEVPFEIRLRDFMLDYNGRKVVVVYIGYIDLIVWDHVAAEYSVIDIKTTRNNVSDKTALYKNDEQALPYGLIVSQLVGQDITELEVHYLSAYVDALNPTAQLYSFRKTQADVRDWARTLLFRLRNLNDFMALKWFPRTGSACMNFKKNCRYFEACHYRDPSAIVHFMDANEKNSVQGEFEPWIKIDLELAA